MTSLRLLLALVVVGSLGCSTPETGKSRPEYVTQDWDGLTSTSAIAKNMLRFNSGQNISVVPFTRALIQSAETKKKSATDFDIKELVERRTCFLVSLSGHDHASVQIQNWAIKLVDASTRTHDLTQFPVRGFWAHKKVISKNTSYEHSKDYTICTGRKANLRGKIKVSFAERDQSNEPLIYAWEF